METDIVNILPFAPRYCWLALAAFFLALEAFGAAGVGLLFGGIAALIIGGLLELDIVQANDLITQTAIWFGITVILALFLYKPLKRWRTTPDGGQEYNNIIGDHARVAPGGLMLGKLGKVYWSGTMMNAQISPLSSKEAFLEGDEVQISDTRGNQLMVMDINDPLPVKSKE